VRYFARCPGPPLDDVIECFWALSDAPGHARELIVPTGTIELVINLQADAFRIFDPAGNEHGFRGAIASGCYSNAFGFDASAHALIVGAHFKPAGAARLLGAPPGALANAHAGLDDLWGSREASELRERLCAAPTARRRIDLLEQALIARLPDDPYPRRAVTTAVEKLDQPGVNVGAVARDLGLSRRRFIEIFSEDVGMPPKRYSMVRRFQHALAMSLQGTSADWARIAVVCGYYDQAHLCRDWAELTGVSPAELVRLRAVPAKDNHVALPEPGVKSVQYASAPRS
jgi:AraC-like DNA-binding protein